MAMPLYKKSMFAAIVILGALLLTEAGLRLVGFEYVPQAEPMRFVGMDVEDAGVRHFIRSSDSTFWELIPGADLRRDTGSVERVSAIGTRGFAPTESDERAARVEGEPVGALDTAERGVRRVVALGDSCTFGMGIALDAIFPSRLEAMLTRALPGETVEVINGGVPGYTTHQMLVRFRENLVRLRPDVVVVYAGHWNDFGPALGGTDRQRAEQARRAVASGSRDDHGAQRFGGVRSLQAIDRLVAPMTSKRLERRIERYRREFVESRRPEGARVPLDHFRDNLDQIVELARGIGADVFLLPGPSPRDTFHGLAWLGEYQDEMRALAATSGAAIVETQNEFRERPDDEMFIDFIHPSAAGHEVIAAALARAMQDRGVLGLDTAKRIRTQQDGTVRDPSVADAGVARSMPATPLAALGARCGAAEIVDMTSYRVAVPGEIVIEGLRVPRKSRLDSRFTVGEGEGEGGAAVRLRVLAEREGAAGDAPWVLTDRTLDGTSNDAAVERWFMTGYGGATVRLRISVALVEGDGVGKMADDAGTAAPGTVSPGTMVTWVEPVLRAAF